MERGLNLIGPFCLPLISANRSLKALMDARTSGSGSGGGGGGGGGGGYSDGGNGGGGGIDPMREIIVLAACGANELLPQVPRGGWARTGVGWGTGVF